MPAPYNPPTYLLVNIAVIMGITKYGVLVNSNIITTKLKVILVVPLKKAAAPINEYKPELTVTNKLTTIPRILPHIAPITIEGMNMPLGIREPKVNTISSDFNSIANTSCNKLVTAILVLHNGRSG
eukprot:NODE_210_length_14612_cov_0.470957.p6 type:complete len:126 gc:universal NODE_210_length_14612_cov_0.470957:3937-4314(+)